MIVALVYGGLFWGIFPVKPEISWESHLWGGVAGFGLALLFRKSAPASLSDTEETEEKDDEEMAQKYNNEAEHEKQEENN